MENDIYHNKDYYYTDEFLTKCLDNHLQTNNGNVLELCAGTLRLTSMLAKHFKLIDINDHVGDEDIVKA